MAKIALLVANCLCEAVSAVENSLLPRGRRSRRTLVLLLGAPLALCLHSAAAAEPARAAPAALERQLENNPAGVVAEPRPQISDLERIAKAKPASKKKRKSAAAKGRRVKQVLLLAAPLAPDTQITASGVAVHEPMAVLDLQFENKQAGDVAKLRRQISVLDRIVKAKAASKKKRQRAALKAERVDLEKLKNALADRALDYVAQIEMAEALGRIDYAQALAGQFKQNFFDMLWRLEQRADSGNARAQATVGTLYRLGIVAERSDEKACEYFGRAAQAGYVTALFHAAACGDPKSEAAVRMLELAAEGDHPVAQEMIGRRCLRERPNAECAVGWLARAAAQGRASATSLLGWMYSTGELVPRDDARAFAYLLDAAKLGDAAAQNNVGQIYETGRGAPVNGEQAFAWYKRAAEAGLGSAQVNLARSYIEGRGTAPDKAAAKSWLERAQKQGVEEAGRLLEWLAAQ